MLKQTDSTATQQKRRLQVAIEIPQEVEAALRKEATRGFRSLSKEVAMRLIRSVQQPQGVEA